MKNIAIAYAAATLSAAAATCDPYEYKELVAREVEPAGAVTNAAGRMVVDFGRDAVGWLELDGPVAGPYEVVVGELLNGRGEVTNEYPRSSIRCQRLCGVKPSGRYRVPMPADPVNLSGYDPKAPAIRLPERFGIVFPFRYAEVVRGPEMAFRQFAVNYPIDMRKSSFTCDCADLVRVYDFCKYAILATSFCGVYVDGDRERTPYEADAYINQLSHYAIDDDYSLARKSHEWLMDHPTWPTEWKQHSIMMAWADWMWTGDTRSLAKYYDKLVGEKLLLGFARASDGLLETGGERYRGAQPGFGDIVDWPAAERDGFEFRPVNAVVNAFFYRNLREMAEISSALGKDGKAAEFAAMAQNVRNAFQRVFYRPEAGLYADGEGTGHCSLHANAIALAFGLVPKERVAAVADFVEGKGMVCSVYFAQYLLEALFEAGRADAAINLMSSRGSRSWVGMIDFSATASMEAWSVAAKPNLDLTHAWSTAPLNVISRYVAGVTPLEPGFRRVAIRPQLGGLKRLSATVPTAAGPVTVKVEDGVLEFSSPVPAEVVFPGKVCELDRRAASLRGLTVGISDTCSTNGAIGVGWYVESVRRVGGTPVVVCRTDDSAGLDAVVSGLDLLVLTGGEDVAPARYGEKPSPRLGRVNAVRDAYEWALLSAAVRHGVPVFGTCRGEQVLNVFFGGTLYQDLPSEFPFNDREVHRSPRRRGEAKCEYLHDILIEPGSRLASVCGGAARLPVNSSHHQAVKGLAPGFRVAARSPEGVVEAIECDWYPAAGVQFHPEILLACNGDPVWTRFYGKLSEFAGRRRPVSRASHPIGVVDSGIGGLSVLEKMLTLDCFDNETGEMKPDGVPDFRDERFVYFGDQANMPYGRYDAAGKADFLRELAVRDAQFVLGSQGHDPSKAVVIACNTATAYGLERVSAMARPGDAAVTGVVNAGVDGVLEAMRGETRPYAIGVMATTATISSGVYQRTLRASLAARGSSVPVEIAARGGIGLAEAVENSEPGMWECARTNIVALVEDYRARGGKAPIRAVVLGCTHYPFVLDEFRAALAELRKRPEFAALVAEDVVFVDPAVNTAIACYRSLRERGLLASRGAADGRRRVEAFISVGKAGPLSDAVKYGRETGSCDIGTRIVPMTADNMPPGSSALIKAMMPASAAALGF